MVIRHLSNEEVIERAALARQRAAASILRLRRSLFDANGDGHRLALAAVLGASDGGGAEIIQPNGYAHVSLGPADTVCGIERRPSQVRDESFGPGVARFLTGDAVSAVEVPGDVTGWNAETAGGGDKHVREVLAQAALHRKGVRSCWPR